MLKYLIESSVKGLLCVLVIASCGGESPTTTSSSESSDKFTSNDGGINDEDAFDGMNSGDGTDYGYPGSDGGFEGEGEGGFEGECANDRDCPTGYICNALNNCEASYLPPPTDCTNDAECPKELPLCNTEINMCVACYTEAECPKNTICKSGFCVRPDETGEGETEEGEGEDGGTPGECRNECSDGDRVCDGNKVMTCHDFNQNGCTSWGNPVECPSGFTCSNGACSTTCSDECQDGQKECNGTGHRECGQFDSDICLDWSKITACADTQYCSQGDCIDMVCTPGMRDCADHTTLRTCNSEGSAWETSPCGSTSVCDLGSCQPKVCNAGEQKCVDDLNVKVCTPAETYWQSQACTNGEVCYDDKCQARLCDPGAVSCKDTNTLQTCNPNGAAYIDSPCQTGTVCVTDQCVAVICTAGETKCKDTFNIDTCNSYGSAWETTICPPDKSACEVNECKPLVCWPDSTSCNGQDVVKCNQYGTAFTVQQTCNPSNNGEECSNGQCLTLCQKAELERSYMGCEYWPVDLPNGGGYNAENAQYTVTASNPHTTLTATVTVTTNAGQVAQVQVPPRSLQAINLPPRNTLNTSEINYQTYRVQSNIPVSVHQFNPFSNNPMVYSNDASLLLPTQGLDKTYIVITKDNSFGNWSGQGDLNGYVVVVGTNSQPTKVSITPTTATVAGNGVPALSAGQKFDATLNQYQMVQIECVVKGCDLTGTTIVADRAVAVYAGVGCAQMPTGVTACDHLESQMFPVTTWGRNFVATRTKPRGNEPDFWRIIAATDGTKVETNPVQPSTPVTLNAGKWIQFESKADFLISADKAVMVGQFMSGQDYGAGTGDPAFMLLGPVEQYRLDYIVLTTSNYAYDRINITAPKNANVTLDGSPVTSGWVDVPSSNFRVVRLDANDGVHMITTDLAVGVMVYGFDQYVSYAYTGGLDLKHINDEGPKPPPPDGP